VSLSTDIKELALNIGYSRIGFAPVEDFPEYEEVLAATGEKYDWWKSNPRKPLEWAHPKEKTPYAKSIITLVYDYAQRSFPPELTKIIGRVYLARCYNPPESNINAKRFALMKDFLDERKIKNESGAWLLPERWAGQRAGVTSFGKNTMAISENIGSFIVINTILVDVELEYDAPSEISKCPKNCTLCIDACPSQALYEPYKLDPRKCIAFNNWMTTKDRGFGISDSIPEAMRPKIGTRVHGCDFCQEACPKNKKKLEATFPQDEFLEAIKSDLTLSNILHMKPGFYEARIKPIMYNYIRDTYLFQRNAAVAMGNTRDEIYIPDLAIEINNEHEALRCHAAWALKQIGGKKAQSIIEKRLKTEQSPDVIKELNLCRDEFCRH
jgi:epoxyqueuosine reductase